MNARLTPEQIVRGRTGHEAIADLTDSGYVIMHADDLHARDAAIIRQTWKLARPATPRREQPVIDRIIAKVEQQIATSRTDTAAHRPADVAATAGPKVVSSFPGSAVAPSTTTKETP